MAKRTDHPLVLLTWVDSHHDLQGWCPLEDVRPIHSTSIETAGFLIDEDEENVRLAMSLGGFDQGGTPQCSAIMTIPKRAVLAREQLRG